MKREKNNMSDEEFMKLIDKVGEDCPAELLDLLEVSQSKWRRAVVKQFILDHLWKKDVEKKLKWISRENKFIIGLLVTLFITLLSILIPFILPLMAGG